MEESGKAKKSIDNHWKIYFKHDGCSMLFMKNLTYSGAVARTKVLKGFKWAFCGNFIITK